MSLFSALRRRLADRRAVSAVEFALVLPLMTVLLTGTADAVLWMQTWTHLEQSASETADITAQYFNLYQSDLQNVLFPIAQDVAGPAQVSAVGGATIISSIVNTTGIPTITWQQQNGSALYHSQFGLANGPAVLPGAYVLPVGETLIAVEVWTTPHPWLLSAGLLGPLGMSAMYSYALFTPRSGQLSTLLPGTRPTQGS